jgi:hypothetical protein
VSCEQWTALEARLEERDEFRELMEEPPGGHNHGRKRGADGGWLPLSEDLQQAYAEDLTLEPEPQAYHRPVKPADTIRHGTYSAYKNDRCRCDDCRRANREYVARRRADNGLRES